MPDHRTTASARDLGSEMGSTLAEYFAAYFGGGVSYDPFLHRRMSVRLDARGEQKTITRARQALARERQAI